MGATYTRQSSSAIVDGGIIEAADINAEFNQVLAAFAASSGHTHDGTAAEGGPITKLLGTAITIGDGTAGTDIAVTFDGETGDGVLTWMEDEDYFQFSDDLLLTTTEKLQFRDTAIYINSSADGQLDLVADTEIQIAATTIDINGAVDISGALTLAGTTLAETISDTVGAMVSSNTETGITVSYEDSDNTLDFALGAAQTTITSLLATDIKIGEDDQTKIDFETADTIHFYAGNQNQIKLVDGAFAPITDSDVDLGTSSLEFKDGYFDGTVYADAINFNGTAISATAAEINLIDGGAMKVTTVQTFATYFASEITAMSNLVTTGALDSGSITSGFGNIDNGASNITSGGLVKLDVDTDADDVSADSATGRLTLGAGEDLNLYHGGTHSYIVNDTGNLVIDTAGDLTFDAAGNDFKFLANGTEILNITNSSSDVIIKPLVDAKDIIFHQRDGTEVLRLDDDTTVKVATDLTVGDDVGLVSDAAALTFGADSEVTLTHVADNGLLLNANMQLQFRDSALKINSSADGQLDIIADTEIQIAATTIDINGNVEISGTAVTTGVHTFTAVPVFPNNSVETADIQDNAITLAKLAGGTDGNIISFDANGDPVAIATGSDGQILTSTGAGSPPAFEDAPASGISMGKAIAAAIVFG